jgi:hypothetical protein
MFGMIRSMYTTKFESLVRYGIILGAYNESIHIFKLQRRVIRRMCGVGTGTSCSQLFKGCKILTVNSFYVFKVLIYLKKYKSSVQKNNRYIILIKGKI